MSGRGKAAASLLVLAAVLYSQSPAGITGSPHDLTAFGGADPCRFCHTPHKSMRRTPGWSRELSDVVYKIYQSSSLDAKPGQPTGASKLCLSCHDGTVAPSRRGDGTSLVFLASGRTNLGTDLSDDHPISFVYSSSLTAFDPQIRPGSALPLVLQLDRAGELQCTTCHNPHDNQFGAFLRMSNRRSAMCTSCHSLTGWMTSSHESSPAATLGASDDYLKQSRYATVAENGCLCCHRPHSAGGPERLLHFRRSEDNCLNCHDGSVARTNIRDDIAKRSAHDPTRYDGIHDLRETPGTAPRHVECVDCHNPHAVQSFETEAPAVQGQMRYSTGVTISGGATPQVQYEYEVCLKCHADTTNGTESRITRVITQTNTRLEFDSTSVSYHPVVAPGRNENVPSLKPPLTLTSQIYCTSCHNADASSSARGPHGSSYEYLLAYRYETADFTQESLTAYELCYQCHSRNSILNDESFDKHRKHLEEEIPCSACHDPHGIAAGQGNSTNNTHLINFDKGIVAKDPGTGLLKFEDLGVFHGRCYLRCHNESHSPKEY